MLAILVVVVVVVIIVTTTTTTTTSDSVIGCLPSSGSYIFISMLWDLQDVCKHDCTELF
jgi:hypothetical protein